jgi:crotonobetainyl-CoA:carnitine CoA-transferase CaiB-like acyl-CoA transferase
VDLTDLAPQQDEREQMSRGPLEGVRILDLTTVIMGPYATSILADLGADVIKVEEPGGDMLRGLGGSRSPGMSGMALGLNRNKRCVVLDLKTPEGRDVLDRLITRVDVVVTNLRPSSRERLGLTYERLREVKDDIVMCTAQAFRTGSIEQDRPAYDDIVQARSGMTSLFEPSAGTRAYAPFIVADKVSGLTIVYSIMAAVIHQRRTGQGQWVDVPMVDTMVAFNLVEHLNGHTFEPPAGEFGWTRVLTKIRQPQRTADGWVCLLPYSDRNWADFFRFTDRADAAADPRFATTNDRHKNMDALLAIVAEAAHAHTTAEWLTFCAGHNIPASEVADLIDIPTDLYVTKTGLVSTHHHPTEGAYRVVASPARFSASPPPPGSHARPAGADTRTVLLEAGLSRDRIEALITAGVAGGPAADPAES